MLKSSRLEDNMNTIVIDQSLCTRSSFEQKFMNNIKKIYEHANKCDDQQNPKDILDAAMVSTPEGVTNNSPNVPMISTPVNKPSASKSLCLFINILDVKPKTEKRRIVAAESKRRAMKVVNIKWTNKIKRKGHSKINEQIKLNMYAWIKCHPRVFQSQFSNDCLKVMLDDQTEPQLVPIFLLRVSVRELYNSLVSDPNDSDIKDDRYEDDKTGFLIFGVDSFDQSYLKE